MPARLPVLAKTPFLLDTNPLQEASSPHAGALATSRAFRSLGFPDLIDTHLPLRKRQRGFTEAQMIESVVLLQTIGGECPDDIGLLADDGCLERGLGYRPPKTTALRYFLEQFHDQDLEDQRPPRESQLSFIVPSSSAVQGLQEVQAGGARAIAALYEQHDQRLSIATIDQDATVIESHKQAAYAHYQGGRGYQPMIALWAEADLIVADEFRDGNVPARQEPLRCARMAFEALPDTVGERYFRGDSACYETDLLRWLSSRGAPGGARRANRVRGQRDDEPGVGQSMPSGRRAEVGDVRRGTGRQQAPVCGGGLRALAALRAQAQPAAALRGAADSQAAGLAVR